MADYYQQQQTPNQTDSINQLHRAHLTVIFRLRKHHAPVNAHLHRIKKEHQSKCVYCLDNGETVDHFVSHCPLYVNIRAEIMPAQPIIHNKLYGSTTQLQRTATYNMSGMNRRVKIIRSMGTKKCKRLDLIQGEEHHASIIYNLVRYKRKCCILARRSRTADLRMSASLSTTVLRSTN